MTEPYLAERIAIAVAKAKRVASGEVETEDDLEMSLRVKMAEYYSCRIMDDYFDRPIDSLLFEYYLISELVKAKSETAGDKVSANLDAAASYASEGFEDAAPAVLSDAEHKALTGFMQTSNFIGEKK